MMGIEKRENLQRIDMHVHTAYSHDGYLTLAELDRVCSQRNITSVAITDHNTIEGAMRARELHLENKFKTRVIVAEEIKTCEGEIIGMFLKKKIEPGMSMAETIDAIREQQGIVYLNHPYGYGWRINKLNIDTLQDLWEKIDIVEIFNGRNRTDHSNDLAAELARKHGKFKAVGTDAHSAWEVGRSYVEMPDFTTSYEFLFSLLHAKYICHPCPFSYRLIFKARKMLFAKPEPLKMAS